MGTRERHAFDSRVLSHTSQRRSRGRGVLGLILMALTSLAFNVMSLCINLASEDLARLNSLRQVIILLAIRARRLPRTTGLQESVETVSG